MALKAENMDYLVLYKKVCQTLIWTITPVVSGIKLFLGIFDGSGLFPLLN